MSKCARFSNMSVDLHSVQQRSDRNVIFAILDQSDCSLAIASGKTCIFYLSAFEISDLKI